MYSWLYHADYVLADLSTTLNANVMYELGVRHTLRPSTCILIGEDTLFARLPFDLSHTIIYGYQHLGEDIAAEPPHYVSPSTRIATLEQALAEVEAPDGEEAERRSISAMVEQAEAAKNTKEFDVAVALFGAALEKTQTEASARGEDFLRQRLALCTYKRADNDPDDAVAIAALEDAEDILALLVPSTSTDPETLGLAGAINKRLFASR